MFKSRAHHEQTGESMVDFLWDEGDPALVKEAGYTSRIANRVLGIAKNRHLSGQSVDLAKLVDDVMTSQPRMSRGAIDNSMRRMDTQRILNRVSERIDKVQARAGQSTGMSFVSPSLQKQGPRHVDLRGVEGYRPAGLSYIPEQRSMGYARRPTPDHLTPSEIKQMNLESRGGTAKSVKRFKKQQRDRAGRYAQDYWTRQEQRAVAPQLSLAERMEQPGVRERLALRRAKK